MYVQSGFYFLKLFLDLFLVITVINNKKIKMLFSLTQT